MRITGSIALFALPLLASANPFTARQASACTSLCSSASDRAAIDALAGCSTVDISCLCTYGEQLSPVCLECVLLLEGLTENGASALCAAASRTAGNPPASTDAISTAVPGSTTATSNVPSSTTTTSSTPSSTTTTAAASSSSAAEACASQCSSTSDLAGVQAMNNCSQSGPGCVCSAASTLSSGCLDCVLDQSGVNPSDWANECAAVSSANSGMTSDKPTLTYSSSKSSSSGNNRTSGTGSSSNPSGNVGSSKGEKVVVGGLLGIVLAAMAALA